MKLENTVFAEPTARGGGYYYDKFLASKDPGYTPERAVRFDLLRDAQEPRLAGDREGGAMVELYGDLKRHRMGRHLADPGGPTPSFAAPPCRSSSYGRGTTPRGHLTATRSRRPSKVAEAGCVRASAHPQRRVA